MKRLTLEIEAATVVPDDDDGNDPKSLRHHFYPSSVCRTDNGESLLTLTSRAAGMRLTEDQVVELRDYLDEWVGIYGRIGK